MSDRLDDPQVFLPELFETHGRHNRTKPAVECGDVTRNWGDFAANINRVAHALISRGVGKGDKVAICMGNSVEMLEAMFGAVRAGACVVPLSGLLTGAQLAHLISDSGARSVFGSADFRERLDDARGEIAADLWVGHGFEADGWDDLAAMTAGAATTPPAVSYDLTQDFNIIYSSGTTGLPKGIVQTHRARLHWAFSNATEMAFTADTRAMTTTALYSNGTWLMMLPVLFAGGTLHVMEAFDPGAFLSQVEAHKITHTFMVPPQFTMVLDRPEMETTDLSSLTCVLCAGSPLRRELKRAVIERLSPRLFELYGFSEGFATMLRPHQHTDKFETVGTPVIGFEVRILDEDGEVPVGTPGEIAGYGAGNMKEYHDRPDLTAELIWRDERGRSFIRSGDVGAVDKDGYLSILDRKKDMIISGGFNVFPADIEEIVGQHPKVRDVTVIGIPHDKWGETCLALIIPAGDADADAVKSWANERLAKHQRLYAVEVRDDFPRNALGKVLKKELRAPYWE